jgi:hypothetical protein
MPFIDTNIAPSWIYDSNLGGIKRIVISDTNIKFVKNTVNSAYTFTQLKNYQFVTGITGSATLGTFSVRFRPPFTTDTISLRSSVLTNGGIEFYTYNTPNNTLQSNTLLSYGSDNSFVQSVIQSTKVNELSFLINGFREFTYLDRDIATSSQPSGWFYGIAPGDFEPSYNLFLSSSASSISPMYSILGSGLNIISNKNFIAKYIEYDTFNIDYSFYTSNPVNMTMYLLTLDNLGIPNNWGSHIVSTFSVTGTYSELGLAGTNYDGTKNYLVFSCEATFNSGVNYTINSNGDSVLTDIYSRLSNIDIYGTYHPTSNNRLSLTDTTTNPIGLSISNAAYSYTLLNNGGTFSIPSRIGNGAFKAGIWENGVWNNGWRDDTNTKDFDDVYISVLTASDVSWKIEIRGAVSAIVGFATGSNVSIGNIVAIDINDNRKLLKDYYQIESLGVDGGNPQNGVAPYGWIRVNLHTSFPYRRIEKDSPNHKIKVTKNIWLSGGFFNGYFSGVWNNGLFKGYPLLTEMFDSHWIDGLFDGGRFNSSYSNNYNFIGIGPKVACSNNFMDLIFASSSTTPFLQGDYIFLTLDSLVSSSVAAGSDLYSGVCQIVDVKIDTEPLISDNNGGFIANPNFMYQTITINKRSIGLPKYFDPTVPAGYAYRYTGSSVIQNFKFYDNNRSKIKSSDSQLSTAVFSFNSWIDVNYDSTRSVTLGRDFRAYEPLTGRSVNRNNLFGYPTYDILSSASRFRDSNSLDTKLYKLGTKYKVFTDFIGDSSKFNDPFNDLDFSSFINAGWTYSYVKPSNFKIKRTESLITLNDSQSTALLNSGVTGDELYITASNTGLILNNNKINIEKSRYSVVEFDVITYSVVSSNYVYDNPDIYQIRSISNVGLSFSESNNIAGAYITSSYYLAGLGSPTFSIDDILVMVDIYGDVAGTTINLKAPNGKIVNLKKIGTGLGSRLNQTKFSLRDVYDKFSYVTTPYSLNNTTVAYSDTYQMDKEIGQGGTSSFLSNTTLLSELVSTAGVPTIYGTWTLFIKYNPLAINVCDLVNWSIDIEYKKLVIEDNEPTTTYPLLNFNNLNYDITTQLSGYDNVQIYKKMNYLPVQESVDHLLAQNTFRLDSVELATPARWGGFGKNQKTKKYEYFYNRTDMMLCISGNGATGGSTSMVVLDNLNMYEVDMIPFFKYFENPNIYKGIVFPYIGTSPEIDYTNSDFIFIDNITIGLDSINPVAVDTTFIDCGTISFASLQLSARINGSILSWTSSSYQFVNMLNSSTPGSVTCSTTTFDSINWTITPSSSGLPPVTITNTNGLYPSVSGLTAGGEYSIEITSLVKNGPPSQAIGYSNNGNQIKATIKLNSKPTAIVSADPLPLLFDFIPGDGLSHIINEVNLLNGYTSSNGYASAFTIVSLPSEGSLFYNGTLVTLPFGPITIVNDLIPGLVYYPEGNPPSVPQTTSFSTSFTYTIIDNDGDVYTATMIIDATIQASQVTIETNINKNVDYQIGEPPLFAAKVILLSEVVQNYTNSNSLSPVSIKILSVPTQGQLSLYNGVAFTAVTVNQVISNVSISNTHFAYWPQDIFQVSTPSGNFTGVFTYVVTDSLGFDSPTVTFNINCTQILVVNGFSPGPYGANVYYPGGLSGGKTVSDLLLGYPVNTTTLRWKATYTLVAETYTDARVSFSTNDINNFVTTLWYDFYEVNGQTPGVHNTAWRNLIPSASSYGNPISCLLRSNNGHTITVTVQALDSSNNVLGNYSFASP